MGVKTNISWCDHTWSPWRGCAKVSPGCANCYAEKLSHRNPAVLGEWGPKGNRVTNKNWQQLHGWDRRAEKEGVRRRVFPSLCDPFENREDLVGRLSYFLEFIADTPNLDWLLLTKRPENWRPLMGRIVATCWGRTPGRPPEVVERWLDGNPPPNLWLGVSVEDQEYADRRIPELLKIPAAVRWGSYEPALGPVEFARLWLEPSCTQCSRTIPRHLHGCYNPYTGDDDCDGLPDLKSPVIDWIVVGGESGPHARPFDLAWARDTIDQCRGAGVACYVKQLGAFPHARMGDGLDHRIYFRDPKGGNPDEWPEDLNVREFPR